MISAFGVDHGTVSKSLPGPQTNPSGWTEPQPHRGGAVYDKKKADAWRAEGLHVEDHPDKNNKSRYYLTGVHPNKVVRRGILRRARTTVDGSRVQYRRAEVAKFGVPGVNVKQSIKRQFNPFRRAASPAKMAAAKTIGTKIGQGMVKLTPGLKAPTTPKPPTMPKPPTKGLTVAKSAFGVEDHVMVSKVSDKTKRQAEIGGAAVIGGGAAQGIYQGAAYGPKKAIRDYYGHNTKMSEFPKRAKQTRAEAAKTRLASSRVGRKAKIQPPKPQKDRKKAWEAAKKAQTKAGIPPQGATKAKFYRTLPKTAPFARTQRVLGYTHAGKLGTAVGTGVTLAGAGGAAALASRRKRQ